MGKRRIYKSVGISLAVADGLGVPNARPAFNVEGADGASSCGDTSYLGQKFKAESIHHQCRWVGVTQDDCQCRMVRGGGPVGLLLTLLLPPAAGYRIPLIPQSICKSRSFFIKVGASFGQGTRTAMLKI